MAQKYANAARAELAATMNNTDAVLTIVSGGALFPVANTGASAIGPGADWFKAVLQDNDGIEIIYVKTHADSSNSMSNILRGQEGTTAREFLAGSVIGIRPLASDAETAAAKQNAIAASDTAPSSPTAGDEWVDGTTGIKYTWVVDDTSAQWVELGPGGLVEPDAASTAALIHAAPSKAAPADADELGLSDSAASWGLKALTFSNLKTWILDWLLARANTWTGGQTMTGGLTVPSLNGGQLAGMRNKIINGDMRIDQRYSGAVVTYPGSVSVGTEMHALDRWLGNSTGSPRFSMQRSTEAPPGFTHSLLITTTTAGAPASGDFCYFAQSIEGYNVADFAFGSPSAKTITIGFWVRSSLTGTFGGSVANAAGSRRFSFSFTITAANTWEYKTVALPGDTGGTWAADTGIGLKLVIDLGSGATNKGTAGAWGALAASGMSPAGSTNLVATNGATLGITGVQLEVGSVATPFEHRPYGVELALCQRYYYRVTNAGGNTAYIGLLGGVSATRAIGSAATTPQPMRSTVSQFEYSGLSVHAMSTTSVGAVTAASVYGDLRGPNHSLDVNVASGLSSNTPYMLGVAQNGYIGFSAEL